MRIRPTSDPRFCFHLPTGVLYLLATTPNTDFLARNSKLSLIAPWCCIHCVTQHLEPATNNPPAEWALLMPIN
jgi:hypothetical protein